MAIRGNFLQGSRTTKRDKPPARRRWNLRKKKPFLKRKPYPRAARQNYSAEHKSKNTNATH